MSNQKPIEKIYDLQERTSRFGENVINYGKKIPQSKVSNPLIIQLVRAGTSVGANYAEADGAESNNDFIHKLGIAKKEAKETKYWLRMVCSCFPSFDPDGTKALETEAHELTLIFSSIINKSRNKV